MALGGHCMWKAAYIIHLLEDSSSPQALHLSFYCTLYSVRSSISSLHGPRSPLALSVRACSQSKVKQVINLPFLTAFGHAMPHPDKRVTSGSICSRLSIWWAGWDALNKIPPWAWAREGEHNKNRDRERRGREVLDGGGPRTARGLGGM